MESNKGPAKKAYKIVIIITVFSFISHINFAQERKNNRLQTEIEIGSFFSRTTFGVNGKVGYLYKESLFLGGGVGLEYLYKARHGGNYSNVRIPIFITPKYSLFISKNTAIIAEIDAGYRIYTKADEDNGKAFFLIPKLGVGFKTGKNRKHSINIYIAYNKDNKENLIGGFIGYSF